MPTTALVTTPITVDFKATEDMPMIMDNPEKETSERPRCLLIIKTRRTDSTGKS